jgi:hypothetical protein
MARPRVHPLFVEAIAELDPTLSYAELRRALIPLAAELGIPRPSYAEVRRIAIEERAYARAVGDAVDPIVAKLLAGRLPSPYDLHRLAETRRSRA